MICSKKKKLQDLGLLIMKNNLQLQFVENVWFKFLILCLCPRVVFLFRKKKSQEILPNLVEKTKEIYVLPKLINVFLPHQALICGCQKERMIYLLLL
jgi:hypothetical protein